MGITLIYLPGCILVTLVQPPHQVDKGIVRLGGHGSRARMGGQGNLEHNLAYNYGELVTQFRFLLGLSK